MGHYDDEVVERDLLSKGERRLRNKRDFGGGEHSAREKPGMVNNRGCTKQKRITVPPVHICT